MAEVVAEEPSRPPVRAAAVAGAACAAVGLAASELVGLVFAQQHTPLTAIADEVISAAPAAPREWLISVVGTADKPLLITAIIAVVLAVGAGIGVVSRGHGRRGPALFLVGGAVAFAVTVVSGALSVATGLLCVGVGVLGSVVTWQLLTRPRGDEHHVSDPERRLVLRASLVLGAAAAVGVVGAAVARRGTSAAVERVRAAVRLPRATSPALALPAGVAPDVPGLAPAVTPSADFYRIDTAIGTPNLDAASWTLRIDGRVSTPLTLTYADLLSLDSIERYVTLACVSNPTGGDLVGNARWQGVRLTDLLARVGVDPGADLIVGVSDDGFTAGFPRALLDDGRDAMVAYAMNGEPLPLEHGFPARLVVPGLYGYVSATKWLTEIRLTTLAEDAPFWVQRGWSADGRVETASRIDLPRPTSTVKAGQVVIAGRAWRQHVGVEGVEVSIDHGSWSRADLAAEIGIDTWRLWSLRWDASPGEHTLRVRAVDSGGSPQSEAVHDPFPGAGSGYLEITVTVS